MLLRGVAGGGSLFLFFCVSPPFDIFFVGSRSYDGEKGICGIKKDWKVDSGPPLFYLLHGFCRGVLSGKGSSEVSDPIVP